MITPSKLCSRRKWTPERIIELRVGGLLPTPLVLKKSLCWIPEDIEAFEVWLAERDELKKQGLDPGDAAKPIYSIPQSHTGEQLRRERAALQSDGQVDLIFTQIATLRELRADVTAWRNKQLIKEA